MANDGMNEQPHQHVSRWVKWIAIFAIGTIVMTYFCIIVPMFGARISRFSDFSANNVHQIGIAVVNYSYDSGLRLPAAQFPPRSHSWRVQLLPYLDRQDLRRKYTEDLSWDSSENAAVARELLPQFRSSYERPFHDEDGRYYSAYGWVTGPRTSNPADGPCSLDEISDGDGLSQTILFGECSGLRIIWTEPRDPDVAEQKIGIVQVMKDQPVTGTLLSSFSEFFAVVGLADGSSRHLSYKIDPKVLAALCTINGGEEIRPTEWER